MSISSKAFAVFQRDAFLFVTNLATGIAVARALGPKALGLWVVLQLIPSYAEAVARVKFDVAAVYVLGKGEHRREDVLVSINIMALVSSAVVIGVIYWQIDWIAAALFGEAASEIRSPLLLLLAQIPLQYLYLNYAYLHIAGEDIVTYNRMVVVRALTNSVLAIGLLWIAALGLWAVVIASVSSFVTGLLYGWAKLDRRDLRRTRLQWGLFKDLASYGFHLYAAGLFGQFNVYGTRTVIVFFLTPVQIAFYGLAQGAGQLMGRVPQALGTILLPRISRSGSAQSVALAANAFRVMVILMIVGGLGLAAVAEILVTVLYGDAYAAAGRALRIMIPGFVVSGAGATLIQYFQASGRAALVPRIQIGPLLVQLLAAWLLARAWGLEGAALALCIGLICEGTVQIAVFMRVTGSDASDLIPRRADLRQIKDLLARSALMRAFASSKSVGGGS